MTLPQLWDKLLTELLFLEDELTARNLPDELGRARRSIEFALAARDRGSQLSLWP